MNLLLIESKALDRDGLAQVTGAAARHLSTVLAVAAGSTVRIGLVDGCRGVGHVVSTSDDAVQLRCEFESLPPPRPRVDLLLALPRPKVMRRLWAQLAALGVGRIILTNAARVERNYFDTHVLGAACYRPLLIEGLQQAQDTWLPTVTIHRQLKVLVEDELDAHCPSPRRVVAHPGVGTTLTEVCQAAGSDRVLLAVGPEGGWTEYELSLLESRGFTRAGIGLRTLRSDTATVALLAVVHEALARISREHASIGDR